MTVKKFAIKINLNSCELSSFMTNTAAIYNFNVNAAGTSVLYIISALAASLTCIFTCDATTSRIISTVYNKLHSKIYIIRNQSQMKFSINDTGHGKGLISQK